MAVCRCNELEVSDATLPDEGSVDDPQGAQALESDALAVAVACILVCAAELGTARAAKPNWYQPQTHVPGHEHDAPYFDVQC